MTNPSSSSSSFSIPQLPGRRRKRKGSKKHHKRQAGHGFRRKLGGTMRQERKLNSLKNTRMEVLSFFPQSLPQFPHPKEHPKPVPRRPQWLGALVTVCVFSVCKFLEGCCLNFFYCLLPMDSSIISSKENLMTNHELFSFWVSFPWR